MPKGLGNDHNGGYNMEVCKVVDATIVGKTTIALRTCRMVHRKADVEGPAAEAKALLASLGDVVLPAAITDAMKKLNAK